ncbi:hypothetical protein D3C85_336380 [compost metagenome]
MADQQQRHAQALLQGFEQQQDLALHGHVERGGRFVGDQQLRFAGQGHGDHHPLSLSTGELMRVSLEAFLGFLDAHQSEQFEDPRLRRFAAEATVQQQGFADLFFDGVQRIQRGHRFLKNHGDAVATQFAQDFGIGADQFLSAIANAASGLRFAFGQQLQNRMGSHRFARARLANQGQTLTGANVQAQVAHHGLVMEGNVEVTDFNQVVSHGHASGSRVEGVT